LPTLRFFLSGYLLELTYVSPSVVLEYFNNHIGVSPFFESVNDAASKLLSLSSTVMLWTEYTNRKSE